MTAMRVAHDDPSKAGSGPSDNQGSFRNPASSYQTATPQQLRAAGIQPVVMNDRNLPRQKSSTFNSFPIYNPNTSFHDHAHGGQNRSFGYEENSSTKLGAPVGRGMVDGPVMSTSSYAKASSTSYHPQMMPNRGGVPQINSVEV